MIGAHCTDFCCAYDCQLLLFFCGDWICWVLCMVQFETFSERIEDVDIDVYRNLDPLKAEPSGGSSFFRDCLTEWRVCTSIFLFEDFLCLICKKILNIWLILCFGRISLLKLFFSLLNCINFMFHLRSVNFLVLLVTVKL